MQNPSDVRDRLIREFTGNIMEKLFYFCLKKTGNRTHAEDLTQDIALQILAALNRGAVPENFSAWVWQIARNRYAVWAKGKHDRNEAVTAADIGDYELPDDGENPLETMIHAEQTALLRRELSFIKSDYRNIVVAYAEKQSISHSVGQIKRILSEAREYAFSLTAASLPPLFKENERLRLFACSSSMISRDTVFMQALRDGWIRYDAHTSRVVGAYVKI